MNLLLDLLVPCLVQLTLPLHWYCIGHRGVGDIYFVCIVRTYMMELCSFFITVYFLLYKHAGTCVLESRHF